jgi:hypothetical protein
VGVGGEPLLQVDVQGRPEQREPSSDRQKSPMLVEGLAGVYQRRQVRQ